MEVGWGRERSVGSGGCMVRYGVCIGGQRRLGRELEEKRSGRKGKRGVWKFGRYIGGMSETAGKAGRGGNSCEVGCAQGKKNGRAGSGVGRGRRAVSSNRQVKREHLGSIIKESACLQDASNLKAVESCDPGMGRQVGSSREGGDIRPCEYK